MIEAFFNFPWQGVAGFLATIGLLLVAFKVGWRNLQEWIVLHARVAELGARLSSYVEVHEREARQWRDEYMSHTEHPPRGGA